MSALLASAWRAWWVDGAILGHSRRKARWYCTVRTDRCPARCARASCSAGAERATVRYVRKRARKLSLGEWVPLSCHKQKYSGSRSRHKLDLHRHKADCTVDHNCSSLQPRALARDRGPTAHVPCQALCVDANGKTYLASPSGGAERSDLIDAVVVVGVLLCTSRGLTPYCPALLSHRQTALQQRPVFLQGPRALSLADIKSTHKPHGCPAAQQNERGNRDKAQGPCPPINQSN